MVRLKLHENLSQGPTGGSELSDETFATTDEARAWCDANGYGWATMPPAEARELWESGDLLDHTIAGNVINVLGGVRKPDCEDGILMDPPDAERLWGIPGFAAAARRRMIDQSCR